MSFFSDISIIKENLLSEYTLGEKHLKSCNNKLYNLVERILEKKDVKIHKIESRIKDRESIEKKFHGELTKYQTLADMTDIIGIRIITYFPEDVDRVAGIIREEFDIDSTNSVDRRENGESTFGYSSLHYVASYKQGNVSSVDYRKYQGMKFEIQIRSILQHAWAEIEHDLGYKWPYEIPVVYRRSFARISALLETADFEFERLRWEISEYARRMQRDVQNADYKATIDKASLSAYIESSPLLREIRNELLRGFGLDLENTSFPVDLLPANEEELIRSLQYYGDITTLQELEDALIAERPNLRNSYGPESGIQEVTNQWLPIYALVKILKARKFQKKVHLGKSDSALF